jgi:hypothetical protein
MRVIAPSDQRDQLTKAPVHIGGVPPLGPPMYAPAAPAEGTSNYYVHLIPDLMEVSCRPCDC